MIQKINFDAIIDPLNVTHAKTRKKKSLVWNVFGDPKIFTNIIIKSLNNFFKQMNHDQNQGKVMMSGSSPDS